MSTEQDLTAMATIMVEARRANEDVGELIAASLQDAATHLGDAEMLVRGRTGSWEVDIIRKREVVLEHSQLFRMELEVFSLL